MTNTELFKSYIHYRNQYSMIGTRKILRRLVKTRNAIRDAGCYSKNSDIMRQNCFVADHIEQIEGYIKRAGKSEACNDKYYEKLVDADLPTKPQKLRKMINRIGIKKHHREMAMNHRKSGKKSQNLALKYLSASIAYGNEIAQEEIDEDLEITFQKAVNQ